MRKPKTPSRTYPMLLPEIDDPIYNRQRREARGTVTNYVGEHDLSWDDLNELLDMLGLVDA